MSGDAHVQLITIALTKREYFASLALPAFIASTSWKGNHFDNKAEAVARIKVSQDNCAAAAVEIADRLVAALEEIKP